jgi:hypothetical protein
LEGFVVKDQGPKVTVVTEELPQLAAIGRILNSLDQLATLPQFAGGSAQLGQGSFEGRMRGQGKAGVALTNQGKEG